MCIHSNITRLIPQYHRARKTSITPVRFLNIFPFSFFRGEAGELGSRGIIHDTGNVIGHASHNIQMFIFSKQELVSMFSSNKFVHELLIDKCILDKGFV